MLTSTTVFFIYITGACVWVCCLFCAGDIEIDWQYVLSKIVEDVIPGVPYNAKVVSSNVTLWNNISDVLESAEREGRFMLHVANDLFSEILKVCTRVPKRLLSNFLPFACW